MQYMYIVYIWCILFILIGIYKLCKKAKLKDLKETIGEVVGHKESYSHNDGINYITIIEYEVDNIKYGLEHDYFGPSKKLGKKIKIKYNPNNPKEAYVKNDFSGIVLIISRY